MRPSALISLTLLSVAAFAQSSDPRPTFEVADVHSNTSTISVSLNAPMQGGLQRSGRYQLRRATMVDLIRTAYGINADNVIGGPSWLETDRFDIAAKAPPGTPQETINLMLQSVLAERFGLVVHNDSRPMQSFVLSLGKGKPKLKEADGTGTPGCQPELQAPEPGRIPNAVAVCRGMTMPAFATAIRGMAGGYLTNPVVDSTGLKGAWDFTLTWTARGALTAAGADGISVFDAVDRQLGLKLEPQKVPTPVLVVDRVNQKPTPNPPGVAASLPPPPPTEFEVADIKPSAPGAPARGGGFQPGGRIDLRGVPLKLLVSVAWDIPPNVDIAGAPKFMDTANYDLIAKATATTGPGNGPPIDLEDLRLMLRNLLADRFKLKTHYEDRPVTAYTLVAVKPKLKPADPSNRTSCKTGPAPVAKDAPPGPPPFQAVCQNITMAQFAEQLQRIAPVYLQYPTENATELEGAFDFTLTFSPVPPNQLNGGGGGRNGPVTPTAPPAAAPSARTGDAAPSASEPVNAISLFDALSRQLGLKLEARKRPLPVLVIDHIEEKPTDN